MTSNFYGQTKNRKEVARRRFGAPDRRKDTYRSATVSSLDQNRRLQVCSQWQKIATLSLRRSDSYWLGPYAKAIAERTPCGVQLIRKVTFPVATS